MTDAGPRFLKLSDVAGEFNITAAQTYALVRTGDLPAIKVGGRGQWRVERSALEAYLVGAYELTRTLVEQGQLDDEPPPGVQT